LRGLRDLKLENSVYNFDFMAFGVFNQTKKWDLQLWTPSALEFFQNFVNSWFADSFSLYMLELFEHQKWKKNPDWNSSVIQQSGLFWNEDEIYEEFDILKNIIQDWWYKRYEISNFAAVGKSSIHNRVYREMEDYLWLWLSASSFINARSPYFWAVVENLQESSKKPHPTPLLLGEGNHEVVGEVSTQDSSAKPQNDNIKLSWIRRTNTPYFPKYIWNDRFSESAIQPMSESDYLIESFFLGLRTDRWIDDISKFKSVLVKNYSEKIKLYEKNGFLKLRESGFVLTDEWMDCYNGIITELLEKV
jgi:coproporphyrinogen III oxidase-like Fe-S oxidoreductase